MKKLISLALAVLAAGAGIAAGGTKTARAAALSKEPAGKAAYLCDEATGTVIYAKNETERLPIASMCKIMTLILTFEAVESGNLKYDEPVTVSERAAGMGGSQVFLGAGLTYTAEQLMKSVAVCSANDSCVALAERVSGSEEGFVSAMNARAKELGAENTLFSNCTGLPKDPQYSCAKDVSVMLKELLRHQKYFEFSRVWMEDFAHPDGRTTSMTNTNKLVRFYKGCDGGKTGYTNEAGSCLAATARRGDTRLIAVVIGAENSKSRNAAVSSMFDEAFATYETRVYLEGGAPLEQRVPVQGGKEKEVAIAPETSLKVFGKRGETGDLTLDITIREALKAPVGKGEHIGTATLYRDGVEIAKTDVVTLEAATRFGWWDAYRELAHEWA